MGLSMVITPTRMVDRDGIGVPCAISLVTYGDRAKRRMLGIHTMTMKLAKDMALC